jgi:hypothetical protein
MEPCLPIAFFGATASPCCWSRSWRHSVRCPRWIGWLGLLVGALAGWLGLLRPASSVISAISSIGFVGFFVFMLSMGIALFRRRSRVDEVAQASAQDLR